MSIASLPMYDLAELREATDAWWSALAQAFRREKLRPIPDRLLHNPHYGNEWRDPALLFSQCCGYDFTHPGGESLQLIATPVYAVADCLGPHYCSVVVVRETDRAGGLADLRGYRCVVNSVESHSGYNALRYMIAPLAQQQAFFAGVVVSGSHAASLQAIVEQTADCAAIDCVTFALLRRYRPAACDGLRVLMRTPHLPGLPYVTHNRRSGDEVRRLQSGLQAALADPAHAQVRAALLIEGAVELTADAYQPVLAMEQHARHLAYPRII